MFGANVHRVLHILPTTQSTLRIASGAMTVVSYIMLIDENA